MPRKATPPLYATLGLSLMLALLAAGCATTAPREGEALQQSTAPAWSIDTEADIVIAVSPTRQTLQLAGTTGTIIGAGLSAAENEKYRDELEAALGDYDGALVFEKVLSERMEEALGASPARVEPLQSTAGFSSRREAEAARRARIAKRGHDLLLDLDLTYGLYGVGGDLVATVDGSLVELPGGTARWRNTLDARPGPLYASTPLGDTTNTLGPDLDQLRLRADDDAVSRWLRDGGASLRQALEEAYRAAAAMLVVDMELTEDAFGAYHRGKQLVIEGEQEAAIGWFDRALAWNPNLVAAQSAKAVALGHLERTGEAIALAEQVIADYPQYGPAHYNLAWWHATVLEDPAAARPHYEQALLLGESVDPRLEEALN